MDILFGPDFKDFPVLDMAVIDQMRIDTGVDTIPMLIGVFKEELEMRVVSIKIEFARRNLENLCRESHTLKSSSASFGAMQMNALSKAIELAARASNFDKNKFFIFNLLFEINIGSCDDTNVTGESLFTTNPLEFFILKYIEEFWL